MEKDPVRFEYPDDTPMALPIGFERPESLDEKIMRMIRSRELAAAAEAAGSETLEEAEDFDVGDDYDPTSPYEMHFNPPPTTQEPPKAPQKPGFQEEKPVSGSPPPENHEAPAHEAGE